MSNFKKFRGLKHTILPARHIWAASSVHELSDMCSTQLSKKFILLINLKLVAIANAFLLNIAEHENFSANKYENANYCC